MLTSDRARVTGPYKYCRDWDAVLDAVDKLPADSPLHRLADNYRATRHPACLNAIMRNAPCDLWIAYHRMCAPDRA